MAPAEGMGELPERLPPPLPWERSGRLAPEKAAPSAQSEKALGLLCYLTFFFGCFVVSAAVYVNYYRVSTYLRFHAGNAANMQFTFLVAWLFCFANLFLQAFLRGSPGPWLLAMLCLFLLFLPLSVIAAVLGWQGRKLAWPIRFPFSRDRLAS